MATPFDADLGTEQGRIQSSTSVLGTHVLQLGSSIPGKIFRFNGPSNINFEQNNVDFTGINFLKFALNIRGVHTMPLDGSWLVSLLVDGSTATFVEINDARNRSLRDIGAVLDGGEHDIAFSLSFNGGTFPVDVEMPGVEIDAIVESDDVSILYNTNPEQGDVDVPVDAPVKFKIETVSGTVDLNRTRVYVNGQDVYVNGVYGAEWFANSTITTTDFGYSFSFRGDDPFQSESSVVVEVFSALTGEAPDTLHYSWTFKTEDIEAPEITEAFATTDKSVRITYNDQVTQDTTSASALTLANYALTLVSGAPAVTPTIVSVASLSPSQVLLTLDKPMTRGAVYRVTVTNVSDTSNNVVTAPANKADFVGYICPAPAERDFLFYEMLPPYAKEADDERGKGDLRKFTSILQEIIDLLLCEIDRWPSILDPDTAPEEWLNVMLADLGNPFTFELSLTEKRQLVQILVDIYRSKGTGPGIINAIRLFLGIEATINVPGWAPLGLGDAVLGESLILGSSDEGVLLTFQIIVNEFLTDEQQQRLLAIVDYMSDAREFFVLVLPSEPPETPDHWALGFSHLSVETILHA